MKVTITMEFDERDETVAGDLNLTAEQISNAIYALRRRLQVIPNRVEITRKEMTK